MTITLVSRVHAIAVGFLVKYPRELVKHGRTDVVVFDPLGVFSLAVKFGCWDESQPWFDLVKVHHLSFMVFALPLGTSYSLFLKRFYQL